MGTSVGLRGALTCLVRSVTQRRFEIYKSSLISNLWHIIPLYSRDDFVHFVRLWSWLSRGWCAFETTPTDKKT